MLVYQPSVSRIAVFECGPLLAFRRTRPTRVVRRRSGRRALTGPVNTASNRWISGSPVRSKHPLEATRRVRSRHVWSVDGGGEPVDVGDRTLSWSAVEVELELEVLSRPPGRPGALASARVLEQVDRSHGPLLATSPFGGANLFAATDAGPLMGAGSARSGLISSIGIGKTTVELWFEPMSSRVCM